jgi:TPP-dependent pyruvate/acetoin dehydrogenase alpha subunit
MTEPAAPKPELGLLADPAQLHGPLDIDGADPEQLERQLVDMLRIRMVEQHLGNMRRDGHIGGPIHLGVGQEAVAVGVSASLRASDRVFGAHRSHSHLLALGSSIHGLFAETLGKDTGLSRGMGGSMHLWDQSRGFYGSVPIVAGTVSLAVGAAMAARLQGTDDIGVAYFGDGAVEEGIVHESMNLASVQRAPVLFVVENNLFSSHMHISLRQPADSTARFAVAHRMAAEVVDGNDVVVVQRAAARLIARARAGEGPGFLEAITFRWYGHVDWREDIDVGVNRSTDDLANWRARDPIARLATAMKARGLWSDARHEAAAAALRAQIDRDWAQAMSDPYPAPSSLLDRVYATSQEAHR